MREGWHRNQSWVRCQDGELKAAQGVWIPTERGGALWFNETLAMPYRIRRNKEIEINKINETKAWFFKKISKIEKPLAILIK